MLRTDTLPTRTAILGFAEPTELNAKILAGQRADAVKRVLATSIALNRLMSRNAGTELEFSGENRLALLVPLPSDTTLHAIRGPIISGPLLTAPDRLKRRMRWRTDENAAFLEVKFPQVEESINTPRLKWGSYRIVFLPSGTCVETLIYFNFFSMSKHESIQYVTAEDRLTDFVKSVSGNKLLRGLKILGECAT